MAGTELAKAYVQIIPSSKGVKEKLSSILGTAAGPAGKSAGGIVGSGIASAIKKAVAAAGIGAAIKQSLTEGAALQQSLGGIETLFKNSTDKVVKNAKQAYKTAGMSANEYMETVTSFSASLLQGLAGDTDKAADVADMALKDMSDNENKMGTSMDLIQNAYQGFAKQNYTMLDNLKLGYGGTKTEMQRLLADAQKITGIKYDIGNLSDVYNAIHVIQNDLGITGTTALEAATTFSGSFASMKAAVKDLLGNLAIGEDIKPAVSALMESTGTFVFDNLLPMLGNIMKGIFEYIVDTAVNTDWSQVITNALASIRDYLSEGLKTYFGADTTLVNDMFGFLIDGFPEIMTNVQDILSSFWEVLSVLWEEIGQPIFDAIQGILSELYERIVEKLPEIVEFVSTCFDDISVLWEEHLKPCLEAIGTLIKEYLAPAFEAVFKGIIEPVVDTVFKFIKSAWEDTLKPVLTGIIDFLTGVFTLDFEKAWEGIKDILKGIINGMITIVEGFINGAISALNGLFSGANFLIGKVGGLFGISEIPLIDTISLPRLENGGILERGQIGLLEGSGAEAVVPLENNARWISKVANDMLLELGNGNSLERVIELLEELRNAVPEEIAELLANIRISIGEREFAKLLRDLGYA